MFCQSALINKIYAMMAAIRMRRIAFAKSAAHLFSCYVSYKFWLKFFYFISYHLA